MTVEARIHVSLKRGVLDPQGHAVAGSLRSLGYGEVAGARVGRTIVLTLEGDSADGARPRVERMCAELLANPVIETWRIEEIRVQGAAGAESRQLAGSLA